MADFTTGVAFGALVGAIGAASVSIGSFLSRRAVSSNTTTSNETDENGCSTCGKKRRERDDDDEDIFLSTPNKRTRFERELKRSNAFYIPRSESPRRRKPLQPLVTPPKPAGGNLFVPTTPSPTSDHLFVPDCTEKVPGVPLPSPVEDTNISNASVKGPEESKQDSKDIEMANATTPQLQDAAEELRCRVSSAPIFTPRNKPSKYVLPPLRTINPPQSPSVKANDPAAPPLRGKSRAKPAPRTAVWRSSLVARAIGISVAHARAPGGWKKLGGGHLIKAMVDFDNNMRIIAIPYNGRGALTFDATVDSLETTITDRAIFREGGIFVVTLRERAGLMRYMLQIATTESAQQLHDAIADRIVQKPAPPIMLPGQTPTPTLNPRPANAFISTPTLTRTHSVLIPVPAQPVASTSKVPSAVYASPTSAVSVTARIGFTPLPPSTTPAEMPPPSQIPVPLTPTAPKPSPLTVPLPPTPERLDEDEDADADDEDSFSTTADMGSPCDLTDV